MPWTPWPPAKAPAVPGGRSLRAQLQQRRQRAKRRGGEQGNLVALEGVFVGMLMVTSVAIVASLQTPEPSIPPTRAPMESQVRDILAGLERLSSSDAFSSQMERAIAQAILGNETTLERYFDKALPPGTECRFWLDNGKQRRQLAGPLDRPARQSVSASQLYHPEWAYALVVPTLDTITTSMPLELQGLAVSQGAMVKEYGVPVRITATTSTGDSYAKNALTQIHASPSASLYVRNATGSPALVYREPTVPATTETQAYDDRGNSTLRSVGNFSVSAETTLLRVNVAMVGAAITYTITLTPPGGGPPIVVPATGAGTVGIEEVVAAEEGLWQVATSGNIVPGLQGAVANLTIDAVHETHINMTVVVAETSGKPLPEGTRLTVRLPSAFGNVNDTLAVQEGWRNVVRVRNATDGMVVTAELNATLAGGERAFEVRASRPFPADALYHAQLELSNGSSARANVVIAATGVTNEAQNPIQHGLYVAVPKPQGPGATNLWGAAFSAAYLTPAGLPETIRQVDIVAPNGEALFAAIQPVHPPSGWTLLSPSHIQWKAALGITFLANAADHFLVNVTTTTTTGTDEPSRSLPVQFRHGTVVPLAEQVRPWVFGGVVPPQGKYAGYEIPAMQPGQIVEATLGVEWHARALRVAGNATYNVTDLGTLDAFKEALRLGLMQSRLNLSQNSAKVGEQVTIEADFQGLLDNVDLVVRGGATYAMLDWRVDVLVLDPAQPFTTRDKWTPLFSASTTSASTEAVFKPAANSLFGPHAVLAQAKFVLKNLLTGEQVVETARLLAAVDVLPDGGQSETALYWVTLECWLPDW